MIKLTKLLILLVLALELRLRLGLSSAFGNFLNYGRFQHTVLLNCMKLLNLDLNLISIVDPDPTEYILICYLYLKKWLINAVI